MFVGAFRRKVRFYNLGYLKMMKLNFFSSIFLKILFIWKHHELTSYRHASLNFHTLHPAIYYSNFLMVKAKSILTRQLRPFNFLTVFRNINSLAECDMTLIVS